MNKQMRHALVAMGLAVGFAVAPAQADWFYDASAKTISDGTSTLTVSASGTELSIGAGHAAVGETLDFSMPVTDGSESYAIVEIKYNAFNGKAAIKKVVYPDTLRTIGGQAFQNCGSLAEVLPALAPDSLTSFNTSSRGVYENCTSITQAFRIGFAQPILTGGGQWIANTKVSRAEFGPYIKTIPSYCWERTPLKELHLSEGLETWNGGSNMGSLTNIVNTFPTTLKTINQALGSSTLKIDFADFPNVTTLNTKFTDSTVYKAWFGPGISAFPQYLFERNNHVTNITICTTNAITIGNTSTFGDMDEMQEFTFMGPAQSEAILNSIFKNVTDLKPIVYVSRRQAGWTILPGLEQDVGQIEAALGANAAQYAGIYGRADFLGLYTATGGKRVWMIDRASIYDPEVDESEYAVTFFVDPPGVATSSPAIGLYVHLAGDVIAVSVPQYGTDGASCLTCTGWVLEHQDANRNWVTDDSGSELAFNFTVPSGDVKDLRFRWVYSDLGDARRVTLDHSGPESITFSSEPRLVVGGKRWFAAGTPVTITATGNATAPVSLFVKWIAGGSESTNPVFAWDALADIDLHPFFEREWLYYVDDVDGKTKITDGNYTLRASAVDGVPGGLRLVADTAVRTGSGRVNFANRIADAQGAEYALVAIGPSVFGDDAAITEVVLPETSLVSIGSYAFGGCSALTNVTPFLPDSVTNFNYGGGGNGPFINCTALTSDLRFGFGGHPVDAYWGTMDWSRNKWFLNTGIKSAAFGPGIKVIPYYAFEVNSLTNLVLSEGLEQIQGGQSFGSLRSVSLSFPDSLQVLDAGFKGSQLVIPEMRFMGHTLNMNGDCAKIYQAYFGPCVTNFPEYLFERNTALTNLTFCAPGPITVASTTMASGGGSNLETVNFQGAAPSETHLDRILANVGDLKAVVFVSLRQEGWSELDGLIAGKAAVEATLTEAQRDAYRSLLDGPIVGLYPVGGNAARRAWILHKSSPYDPKGTVFLLR